MPYFTSQLMLSHKSLLVLCLTMLAQFASITCAHAVGSYFDIYCGRGNAALATDPRTAEKYYKLALAEALTGDDPQADPALARCGLAKAYVCPDA